MSILSAVLMALGVVPVTQAGEKPSSQDHRKYVTNVAGIHLNLDTTDDEVVKKYGLGCYIREEGHGGGRYFLDPTRSVTLHTVIGVDHSTDEIELSAFVDLPAACYHRPDPTTPSLPGNVPIEHGVKLGMSVEEIAAILGNPTSEERRGIVQVLVYTAPEDDAQVGACYEARYRFLDDRLTRLSVSCYW